jgi:enamine deaminase RidA (YjgF/YER057c/UK114 family)
MSEVTFLSMMQGSIAQQKMEAQAEALQQIRRVLASIENLRSFLRNFTEGLAGFRPLQQCIDRIVELNTCGRCVAVRQPFCRNVCAAIARACYSPFNDALENQMEVLWEVVRRILDRATDAIDDLNENRGFLDVDNAALVSEAISRTRRDGGRGRE